MDPSSVQNQEMHNQSLENLLVCSKSQQEKKPRPQPEQALKCPRCESTNTKFCYYNNYSLSQPRYFCKSCRRYWTKGGTLRNVPVGGGCRKNKRSSSSKIKGQDQPLISAPNTNTNPLISSLPSLGYDPIDLTLAFARLKNQSSSCGQLGFDGNDLSIFGSPPTNSADHNILGNATSITSSGGSALDSIRNIGYLGAHNGTFNNLYYGFCSLDMGDHDQHCQVENNNSSSGGVSGDMVFPYEDTSAASGVKQEVSFSRDQGGHPNRALWGFPWQMNGESNKGTSDLHPTWHGLLNSPLM